MRILHTSDWHLGKSLEGRCRLEEQEQFLDELYIMVNEEKIDLVVVAGDVFDTANPSAVAEQLFYAGLNRLAAGGERGVVVIAGNHDNPVRLKAASPLANRYGIILSGLPADMYYPQSRDGKKVSIIEGGQGWLRLFTPRCGEEAVLLLLPYPSEARLREALVASIEDEQTLKESYSKRVGELLKEGAVQFKQNTINLAESHLFAMGGKESDSERPIHLGGALAVEPSFFPRTAHYTALGHLHRPQEVKAAPCITRYSGSPLAYSFSEAGQAKSVTLVEASPGGESPHVEDIYLSSGRPLVKWQAREGLDEVYRWLDEGRDNQAWIDLEVYVTDAIPLRQCSELRKLHDGIVNIRPVLPEMQGDSTWQDREGLPLDKLFIEFYTRQKGGARPDDKLVELFLELVDESGAHREESEESEVADDEAS